MRVGGQGGWKPSLNAGEEGVKEDIETLRGEGQVSGWEGGSRGFLPPPRPIPAPLGSVPWPDPRPCSPFLVLSCLPSPSVQEFIWGCIPHIFPLRVPSPRPWSHHSCMWWCCSRDTAGQESELQAGGQTQEPSCLWPTGKEDPDERLRGLMLGGPGTACLLIKLTGEPAPEM